MRRRQYDVSGLNFNFMCGRPHGAGPPPPVHMRPPEPDPLPLRVDVINGWPIILKYQCIQLVLFILTYVFPAAILLCVYKYDVYGLATFFCYNHRYYKAYNIYGYNTSLVFHLESSNENLKYVWSQVTQMRVIEMKNKCHKTLIVTVHQ